MKHIETQFHGIGTSPSRGTIQFYGGCTVSDFIYSQLTPAKQIIAFFASRHEIEAIRNTDSVLRQFQTHGTIITLVYDHALPVPKFNLAEQLVPDQVEVKEEDIYRSVREIISPNGSLQRILRTPAGGGGSAWRDYCTFLEARECSPQTQPEGAPDDKEDLRVLVQKARDSWDDDRGCPLIQLYYGGPLIFDIAIATFVVSSIGVFFQPLINDVYKAIKERLQRALKKKEIVDVVFRIHDSEGVKSITVGIPPDLLDDKTPAIVLDLLQERKDDVKKVLMSRRGYRETHMCWLKKNGDILTLHMCEQLEEDRFLHEIQLGDTGANKAMDSDRE